MCGDENKCCGTLTDLLFVKLFVVLFSCLLFNYLRVTQSSVKIFFCFQNNNLEEEGRGIERQREAAGSLRGRALFILHSGGARKSDWGKEGRRTACIKLDEDHCKWTQAQRTLLLPICAFACTPTHTNTHTHAATLSHVHLGDEAHFASTWSALAYTPSPSCVHPLITDTDLSFLCFTSPSLCRGGAFDVQFWGTQGVIWGLGGAKAVGQANPSLISTTHQRLNYCLIWGMANSWDA